VDRAQGQTVPADGPGRTTLVMVPAVAEVARLPRMKPVADMLQRTTNAGVLFARRGPGLFADGQLAGIAGSGRTSDRLERYQR